MYAFLLVRLAWGCVMVADNAPDDVIVQCKVVCNATATIVATDNANSLRDATRRLVEVLAKIDDSDFHTLDATTIREATTDELRFIFEAVRLLRIAPTDEFLVALTDSIDSLEITSRVAATRYLANYMGNQNVDELIVRLISETEDIGAQLKIAAALLGRQSNHRVTDSLVQRIFDRGGLRYEAVSSDFFIEKSIRGEILSLCAEAEYVSDKLAAKAISLTSTDDETGLAANLYLAVCEASKRRNLAKYFESIVATANNVDAKLQPLAVSMCLNSVVVPKEVRNEVFESSINSNRKETRKAALEVMAGYVGDGVSIAGVVRSVNDEDLITLFQELEYVNLDSETIEHLKQRLRNAADPVEKVFMSRILFTSLLRNLNGISDDKLALFLVDIRRSERASLVADAATEALLAQEAGLRDSLRQDDVSQLLDRHDLRKP